MGKGTTNCMQFISSLSSLVYKFSCTQCVSEYVGSTMRTLHTRVAEHAGRSFRTGALLTSPPHSNIRAHALSCSSPVAIDNFNVLARGIIT